MSARKTSHSCLLTLRETDHDVYIEPLANMPSDMAVKWPYTRIIRENFNDYVPERLQDLSITSLHKTRVDRSVPLARTIGNDKEVVTV